MRLHISQTTLLFNEYLLIDLSLRMATASAMSLTSHILVHSAAISEVLTSKIFLAHDTTTWFRDLSWRDLTGRASKPRTPWTPPWADTSCVRTRLLVSCFWVIWRQCWRQRVVISTSQPVPTTRTHTHTHTHAHRHLVIPWHARQLAHVHAPPDCSLAPCPAIHRQRGTVVVRLRRTLRRFPGLPWDGISIPIPIPYPHKIPWLSPQDPHIHRTPKSYIHVGLPIPAPCVFTTRGLFWFAVCHTDNWLLHDVCSMRKCLRLISGLTSLH